MAHSEVPKYAGEYRDVNGTPVRVWKYNGWLSETKRGQYPTRLLNQVDEHEHDRYTLMKIRELPYQ